MHKYNHLYKIIKQKSEKIAKKLGNVQFSNSRLSNVRNSTIQLLL